MCAVRNPTISGIITNKSYFEKEKINIDFEITFFNVQWINGE